MALPEYKTEFLNTCLKAGALSFGTFTLKSGRQSPYFFNAGLFHSGKLVRSLSTAFGAAIEADSSIGHFDILFGPAYKGIPLAATTADKLAGIPDGRFDHVHYAFDRKEAKLHGDGGSIVGAPLKGKRIVIIDDVITAGTAIREAIKLIDSQGGILVGIIVALDRQEKAPSSIAGQSNDDEPAPSAVGKVRTEFGVPVIAIVTLDDLIRHLDAAGTTVGSADDRQRMEAYRTKYAPTE